MRHREVRRRPAVGVLKPASRAAGLQKSKSDESRPGLPSSGSDRFDHKQTAPASPSWSSAEHSTTTSKSSSTGPPCTSESVPGPRRVWRRRRDGRPGRTKAGYRTRGHGARERQSAVRPRRAGETLPASPSGRMAVLRNTGCPRVSSARASDADRQQAAEALRSHFAAGRL